MTYQMSVALWPVRPPRPQRQRLKRAHALPITPRTHLRGGDEAGGHAGVGHAGRRQTALLALLAFLFLIVLSCGLSPQPAFAQELLFANGGTADEDESGVITGRARVSLNTVGVNGSTTFNVTMPDGQTLGGHCVSPNHFIPLGGSYSFTAYPNGDGSYDVTVWSSSSQGYDPASAASDLWPPQDVGGIRWKPEYAGRIALKKRSGDSPVDFRNASYSLEGAVYGVYSDEACTVEVDRITTDEQGKGVSGYLVTGTYYVREISASPGFVTSVEVYCAPVTANSDYYVQDTEPPAYDIPYLLLSKVDATTGQAAAQGDASLANALYDMRLYGGYPDPEDLGDDFLRRWRIHTDDQGRILFDAEHLSAYEYYHTDDGTWVLPLGTYVLQEVTPSTGYLTSTTRHVVRLMPNGNLEVVGTYVAPTDREQIIRGGVSVQKRDLESWGARPLGSGSFEGISFQITNRSARAVVVNGVSYEPGSVCATIWTDESGLARTADDLLPYGSYEIRETGTGRGYYGNTDWSYSFQIRRQGQVVKIDCSDTAILNQVRRGDISFQKHDAESGALMGYVPFLLVSNTTGEAHVLVTDENGMCSTASSWNSHRAGTNLNDNAVTKAADGSWVVDEAQLNPDCGVWFGAGIHADGSPCITNADDARGALPFDRVADGGGYTLIELPCSSNVGHRMIEATFSVSRDGVTLDLGTFDDAPISIETTLVGQDGDHMAPADGSLTLTDTVRYEGLSMGGAYHLDGELHAFANDGSDLGIVATAQTDFSAEGADGEIALDFSLDARSLGGMRVVAFETLSKDGQVQATHADPDDEGQTVWFPAISTIAQGAATVDKDVVAGEDGITDLVSYEGILPGAEYEIQTSLHLLAEDGSDAGTIAEGVTSFEAVTSQGSVAVRLENLDLGAYGGRDLVLFERIVRDGRVWASHEDLADRDQTVAVPQIRTSAASAREAGVLAAGPDEQIVDTVSYENLLPETTYQLHATVHLVGGEGDALTDEGILVTAEPLEFTTPAADDGGDRVSGAVEVTIPIDLTGLDGRSIVVFERLLRGDVTLATHEDPSDEGQTLVVPAIHTTATSAGDHDALAGADQTIVDEVSYQNLTPGVGYVVTGTLMGIPADDSEPRVIATTVAEFVPEAPDGSVTLSFEKVDLAGLEGGKAVAYEVLTCGAVTIATHQDPTDESQTVHVPLIQTEARGASGTHTVFAGADQAITDTVYYEGLLPEHRYTLTATLHLVHIGIGGAREDGGTICDPSTTEFVTPAAAEGEATVSGEAEVTVHAYLSDLAGSDVVCFEELSREDTTVATHEDVNDAGQTVHVPALATSAQAQRPNESGVATITDRVSYHNLVPGESYVVVGTLHRKGSSGEDLGVIVKEDGQPLTARSSFVAQQADGSVDVAFNLNVDALGLAGESVVVFEELRQEDVIVARHTDIGSLDQLVVFEQNGTPQTGRPLPQLGASTLPYLALLFLAAVSLTAGLLAARKYD